MVVLRVVFYIFQHQMAHTVVSGQVKFQLLLDNEKGGAFERLTFSVLCDVCISTNTDSSGCQQYAS